MSDTKASAIRAAPRQPFPSWRPNVHPTILEAIQRLPVGAGNEVTERWLRPIARLPYDEQLTAVAERLDLGLQEDCG